MEKILIALCLIAAVWYLVRHFARNIKNQDPASGCGGCGSCGTTEKCEQQKGKTDEENN